MPFLDDLIGIKDVLQDGVALPRRAAISFAGDLSVADDRVNEQTVVTFGAGDAGELRTVTYQGEIGDPFVTWFVEDDDLAAADLVRIDTISDEDTVVLKLEGLDITGLTQPRKVIANVGTEPLTFFESGEDDGFVLPGNEFELAPDASVEVMWLAAVGEALAGWRLLGV